MLYRDFLHPMIGDNQNLEEWYDDPREDMEE